MIKTESVWVKKYLNITCTENLENEEEQAAIKIQAAFRGHQTRKTMKSGTGDNNDTQEQSTAEEKAAMEAEFSPEDEEYWSVKT
ncbi:hypothetical protein J437_LFUL004805 [Ladona fulva]|uniref:Sperm surface protein Sp17 n=1 Tax=Ladona fulva TaxID=123851 RepID=A0A8K0NYJ3_LADFU|nr:hypothetical protein J437_LFUL004805 [Ladona fulva]